MDSPVAPGIIFKHCEEFVVFCSKGYKCSIITLYINLQKLEVLFVQQSSEDSDYSQKMMNENDTAWLKLGFTKISTDFVLCELIKLVM